MTDGKRIGICGRLSEGSFCSCIHCLQTGYSVEPAVAHGTCSSFLMLWNLIFSNHQQVPILFIDTVGDNYPSLVALASVNVYPFYCRYFLQSFHILFP